MTELQRQAHERMLKTLPVRDHRLSLEVCEARRALPKIGHVKGKHKKDSVPVVVNGMSFPSINRASQATGCSRQKIHQWLLRGDKRAAYA